jgi:hypothetical protein
MALPNRDSFDLLPRYEVKHDGCVAELIAVPKKREARGLPDVPPVGGQSGDCVWVRTHEQIRSALKKKAASHYDLGGLPYVVAVRMPDPFTRLDNLTRALYGVSSDLRKPDLPRDAIADLEDGFWATRRGSANTSLSGLLSVMNVFPWSVEEAKVCLFVNPWSSNPLASQGLELSEGRLTASGVEYLERTNPIRHALKSNAGLSPQ